MLPSARKYPHFREEWKAEVRRAWIQRAGVGVGGPGVLAFLAYLERPTNEIVFAGLIVAGLTLLSEIQIDFKGGAANAGRRPAGQARGFAGRQLGSA